MPNAAFWKNKRVFLTGHTGFKGSWLSLWLEQLGAKVYGYSLPPVSQPNLFELAGIEKRMISTFGDVRDLGKVQEQFQQFQPEIVLHLAAQALVRPSYEDPVGTYATNVMGTVHVLEAARKTPSVRAVVNVTSDKCYENREWAWGYRENEAMGGYDPYSSSKGCSELVTAAYRRSFKGTWAVASGRAGNVIGGGDWALDRLIPDCMNALAAKRPIQIRNPDSIRPWQHVLEPLSGYLLLAEKLYNQPTEFAQGWNFGPDSAQAKPVSWIADRMVNLWGNGARWQDVHDPKAPHEAHYLKLDCSMAEAQLGWTPKLSLSHTLQWVVDWYRRVGEGESALKLTQAQIQSYEEMPSLRDLEVKL